MYYNLQTTMRIDRGYNWKVILLRGMIGQETTQSRHPGASKRKLIYSPSVEQHLSSRKDNGFGGLVWYRAHVTGSCQGLQLNRDGILVSVGGSARQRRRVFGFSPPYSRSHRAVLLTARHLAKGFRAGGTCPPRHRRVAYASTKRFLASVLDLA